MNPMELIQLILASNMNSDITVAPHFPALRRGDFVRTTGGIVALIVEKRQSGARLVPLQTTQKWRDTASTRGLVQGCSYSIDADGLYRPRESTTELDVLSEAMPREDVIAALSSWTPDTRLLSKIGHPVWCHDGRLGVLFQEGPSMRCIGVGVRHDALTGDPKPVAAMGTVADGPADKPHPLEIQRIASWADPDVHAFLWDMWAKRDAEDEEDAAAKTQDDDEDTDGTPEAAPPEVPAAGPIHPPVTSRVVADSSKFKA